MKSSGKVEWNDGTNVFADGAYINGVRASGFSSRDCLIVHGNTEHGGGNSLSKSWGDYPCHDKFGAVICQLDINVHAVILNTTATTTLATTTTSSGTMFPLDQIHETP